MKQSVFAGLVIGSVGAALGAVAVVLRSPVLAGASAGCLAAASQALRDNSKDAMGRRQGKKDGPEAEVEVGVTAPPVEAPHADAAVVDAPAAKKRPIDALTGLPDASYFDIAAESRVTAARRHLWPVTVVLLELEFGPAASTPVTQAATVSSFASILRQTLRDADIACRLGRTTFGLVLEDTPEDGGVWTVERLQMVLAKDAACVKSLSAGLATYPTHGLEPAEVIVRARRALARACVASDRLGLGPVEVATSDS
jgi:diguanylate cyclase (GGDEF)-like protein